MTIRARVWEQFPNGTVGRQKSLGTFKNANLAELDIVDELSNSRFYTHAEVRGDRGWIRSYEKQIKRTINRTKAG